MSTEAEDKPTEVSMGEFRRQWIAAGIIDPGAPVVPSVTVDTATYIRQNRLNRFREACPAEFRKKIDRALLPNLAAWDEADKWPMIAPGLFMWSHESGHGKTRMAWRLFGRAHCDHGKHVMKMSGQALVEDYFECHMDGDPRNFYRRMLAPDILIIDDLDKADITSGHGAERNRRALRELWDEIYSRQKAVVVTSNEPISWFVGTMGESCARRMREVCREIAF